MSKFVLIIQIITIIITNHSNSFSFFSLRQCEGMSFKFSSIIIDIEIDGDVISKLSMLIKFRQQPQILIVGSQDVQN